MKRLFMVDYRENGVCAHQCVEVVHTKRMSDKEAVKLCHVCIGEENELDGVFEVFENMTADELSEISQTPLVLTLRYKMLFANKDEINRCVKKMEEVKQNAE